MVTVVMAGGEDNGVSGWEGRWIKLLFTIADNRCDELAMINHLTGLRSTKPVRLLSGIHFASPFRRDGLIPEMFGIKTLDG
jgi:hypothetical protein